LSTQVPALKQRSHDLELRLSLAEAEAAEARSKLEVLSADASRWDFRRVACGVWRVACGVWRVACGVWRVACGVWRVTRACCRGSDLSKSVSAELHHLRKRAAELEGQFLSFALRLAASIAAVPLCLCRCAADLSPTGHAATRSGRRRTGDCIVSRLRNRR